MAIHDIARESNVSISTVSRYINNRSSVAEATAKKIAAAMKRTGYKPRVVRPGRKTPDRLGIRTGIVTFLSIGSVNSHTMLEQPVYPLLLSGIQQELVKLGMTLVFAHCEDGESVPDILDRKACDGVIVFAREYNFGKKLRKVLQEYATVWCFGSSLNEQLSCFDQIAYDNCRVGELGGEYLASRGHRKVVFFNQKDYFPVFQERWEGFSKYCSSHNMEAVMIAPKWCGSFLKNARAAGDEFYSHADITGAFFSSDNYMLGIYNYLKETGCRMTAEDVIGCNNEKQFLCHFDPVPPTIDIRLEKIGREAVRILHNRLSDRNGRRIAKKIEPKIIISEQ